MSTTSTDDIPDIKRFDGESGGTAALYLAGEQMQADL